MRLHERIDHMLSFTCIDFIKHGMKLIPKLPTHKGEILIHLLFRVYSLKILKSLPQFLRLNVSCKFHSCLHYFKSDGLTDDTIHSLKLLQ